MRTCVTGGAGFIGSNLVDRLVADGHEVVVLDDLSTGTRANLAKSADSIRFVEGDLRDPAAVATAVAGCEVVYHMAALASVQRSVDDPAVVTDVNVGGTLHLLIGARDAGVRRVVFASSSSIYGDTPVLPKDESMPTSPLSPYAASKVAGEAYLLAFDASYGLEGVALRYFNVYGPRQSATSQYAAVIPLFIDAMRSGRAPVIHGDGGQTRDFTYVGDVVDALVLAATAPDARGNVMNIGGGGQRISILDLATSIAEALGFEGEPIHEPARVGDVRDSLADISRARALLGWEPRTALREGIAQTVAAAVPAEERA
jgi:UDP-glucose 4-epimerase